MKHVIVMLAFLMGYEAVACNGVYYVNSQNHCNCSSGNAAAASEQTFATLAACQAAVDSCNQQSGLEAIRLCFEHIHHYKTVTFQKDSRIGH